MNIKGAVLSFLLCTPISSFAAESQSLLMETRDRLIAALGKPLSEGRYEAHASDGVQIEVFRKDGWEFKVHFTENRAKRVKVSRLDRGILSDQEIRGFLPQVHPYTSWEVWTGTSRRAWIFKGGKHPTYYCVISENAQSLHLIVPHGKDTPPDLSAF